MSLLAVKDSFEKPKRAWQDRGRLRVQAGRPTAGAVPTKAAVLILQKGVVKKWSDTRSMHRAGESHDSARCDHLLEEREQRSSTNVQGRQSSEEVGDEQSALAVATSRSRSLNIVDVPNDAWEQFRPRPRTLVTPC